MSEESNRIRQAEHDAELVCQQAIEDTPSQYRKFLGLLIERKKVGGSKSNPVMATVKVPYMASRGVIKMARDEHRQEGKLLHFDAEFHTEPTSGYLLCRVSAHSELYGRSTAHARVIDDGQDKTSKVFEKAETRAVARALQNFGYALFGMQAGEDEDSEVVAAPQQQATKRSTSSTSVRPRPPALSVAQFCEQIDPLLEQEGRDRRHLMAYIKEAFGKSDLETLTFDEQQACFNAATVPKTTQPNGNVPASSSQTCSSSSTDDLIETTSKILTACEGTPWETILSTLTEIVPDGENVTGIVPDFNHLVIEQYRSTYPNAGTIADLPEAVSSRYKKLVDNESGRKEILEQIAKISTAKERV